MSEFQQEIKLEDGNTMSMLYDSVLQGKITPEYFSEEYWTQFSETRVLAKGRGTTYYVHAPGQVPWVLRQYRRGGLFGRIVKQSYLFTKPEYVRSFAEYRVSAQLYKLNLPVAKPIAAMYVKNKFSYRAAILTQYVENSQTLSACLETDKKINWPAIALAISQVHQAGLLHSDLNAHNILIDENAQATIIDLDKSTIAPGINLENQHSKSLQRLRRSMEKVSHRTGDKQQNDWAELIYTYRDLHSK